MRSALAIPFLASAAAAQLPFISPTTANGAEASSNNIFPFANTTIRRYQQIHGDLPQTILSVSRLAFRFNTPTAVTTYTGTRAIDMEMDMGNGPASYADYSRTMSNNFSGPITTVVARRIVNWGPQGTSVSPGPQSFATNMDITLDAPYLWIPISPTLTWEARIFGNPATGTFAVLDAGSITTASATTVGTGCVCTGRTTAQTASISVADMQGYLGFAIGTTNGTPSSQVYSAIGFSNPNLPIPGLCANSHTDLTFLIANGVTSAVPAANTTRVAQVSRMFDSSGTTTSTDGLVFTTSTLGYGLPVEFN
ncbi:MAG: hypothetical protein HZB39_07470 [Planctomycetes bacterium]|nr:hypothetical protein [Planctomycetota bacterium]